MTKYPGESSEWFGFINHTFVVDGRRCLMVRPRRAARGRPWIWRARFWAHEPQTDVALLGRGFHVAYMDVAGLYGCPRAVAHWDEFHRYATGRLGLAKRVVLEGFSRGGLTVYNWAARNPEKVACIYGDAPVCDFKSWPGGKGASPGSPEDWRLCLAAYGLTEKEAMRYRGNPIDNLAPLAAAGVPIIHVCGAADEAVPMAENTDIVERRYRRLGGRITVIAKPGCGHHPHSLSDPAPIVEFILEAVRARALGGRRRQGVPFPPAGGYHLRRKGTVRT